MNRGSFAGCARTESKASLRWKLVSTLAAASFLWVGPALPAERLIYHDIKTDPSGRIVPWFGPPAQAYDYAIRQIWKFWHTMEKCDNGLPYYMQHMIWTPNRHGNGLGGDQIPMALSSWNLLYGYLGDQAVKQNMIYMADYWLDHGLSQSTDLWPNMVYSYDTEKHSGIYDGDMVAGKGFLQPDKSASFAAELVVLYRMTGNTRYLDAAVRVADTLARHIKRGDSDHSPWPYRVHSRTGNVAQSKVVIEYFEAPAGEVDMKRTHQIAAWYTTNWTGALRLFDALIAMKQGDTAAYIRTREMLSAWIKAYPLKNNKWGPFFEDVPSGMWSDTEINADTMAWYILENPAWDPHWREMARRAMDWSYAMFSNKEWEDIGAVVINEQTVYKQPGNSHTARHASVELLYSEKTGDHSNRDAVIRRLNWATYMVDTDGRNMYPATTRANAGKEGAGAGHWLTDGYGDYVRHYLRAMASLPDLAPDNQNHLLRTTSVIRGIRYNSDTIQYEKSDASSTERFKLGLWAPVAVSGGQMQWDRQSRVLTVRSNANSVTIRAR
jgi:hypothetical protein